MKNLKKTFSDNSNSQKITKIFALGGLHEVGKNTYCIEYDKHLVIIDAGIKFASKTLLGVSAIIPDYSYLIKNAQKIKALLITHGHEDHLGGIPYLLQKVKIPQIYSPPFASDLIKLKLKNSPFKNVALTEIGDETKLNLGPFQISFFAVTHSVPHSFGIVIKTPDGTIVTTGDFKLDWTPLGKQVALHKLAQIGKKGVTLLLSDSTNAEIAGHTITEKKIIANIATLLKKTTKRVFITTFASNFNRIFYIILAAQAANKKVAIAGPTIENIITIVKKKKYFQIDPNLFIELKELPNLAAKEVVVICTGSQGEPNSFISKLAYSEDNFFDFGKNDLVLFSSKPIPGNSYKIARMINRLEKRGIEVLVHSPFNLLHTSGHACQEEQKIMLALLCPSYFMPIHGEYKMLKTHALTGQEWGLPASKIFICNNGEQIYLKKGKAWIGNVFQVPPVYIGNKYNGAESMQILQERRLMLQNGLIVVILWIDFAKRQLLQKPQFFSRGSFYFKHEVFLNQKLLAQLTIEINLQLKLKQGKINLVNFNSKVQNVVSQIIYEQKKIYPLIHPIILEKK